MSASTAVIKSRPRPNGEVTSLGIGHSSRDERNLGKNDRAKGVARCLTSTAPACKPVGRPVSFALRSTVRYRAEGRTATGVIIGISYSEPLRYDIRRLESRNGKNRAPTSFGVADADVEKLIAPPPGNQKVIVLSDLPPEGTAPVRHALPQTSRKSLFWRLPRLVRRPIQEARP